MKKVILLAGIFFTALLLGGCLSTLHPIFTEKDLVSDPRLIGSWEKAKDKTKISYRRATTDELKTLSPALQNQRDKIYMLEERDEEGKIKSKYFAFMVKLGKYYYMDYYPANRETGGEASDFFLSHYVPMHSIYRIQFKNDNSFSIQQLDEGYLEKLIDNKQVRIKHETVDKGYVITASTEDLQQYLIKYADVPEAYNDDNNDTYTKTK